MKWDGKNRKLKCRVKSTFGNSLKIECIEKWNKDKV